MVHPLNTPACQGDRPFPRGLPGLWLVVIGVAWVWVWNGRAAEPTPSTPAVVTSILAARDLPLASARMHPPVDLTGVVTWARQGEEGFVLADETSAIWVYGFRPAEVRIGSGVRLRGHSTEGYFTSSATISSVDVLDTRPLPASKPALGREQLAGRWDNLRVHASGTVFDRLNAGGLRELMLLSDGVPIWIGGPPPPPPLPPLPRRATVTGISSLGVQDREIRDCALLLDSWDQIQWEPADDAPPERVRISDLAEGYRSKWLDRPVEIAGLVTWTNADHFVLQDRSRGILVSVTNTIPPTLHREVRVTGTVNRTPRRLDFVAIRRETGLVGSPPTPTPLGSEDSLHSSAFYGRVVTLEGRLVHRHSEGAEDQFVVVRSARPESLRFSLPVGTADWLGRVPLESTLSIRGVLLPENAHGNHAPEAVVLISSLSDIRKLRPPPLSHAASLVLIGVTGGTMLASMAGAAWWWHSHRLGRLRQTQLEIENRLKSRFALIAETASDQILTLDLAGRITFINPVGHRLLALPGVVPAGQRYARWIAPAYLEAWEKAIAQAATGAELLPFDIVLERADGVRMEVEVVLHRLNDKELQCIGRDLTEARRAQRELARQENHLRTIVESMAEGILVLDAGRRVLSVNPAAERILAVPRHKLVQRQLAADWDCTLPDGSRLAPEDYPIIRALATGEAVADFQFSFMGGDGERRWITMNIAVLARAPDGLVEQVITTFADITARRRAEAQHERLEEQLRHSEKLRALGTLAGGVAHDFNNMLASMLCNAELIQMDVREDATAAECARQIASVARRGADLVRRILSFSSPDGAGYRGLLLSSVVESSVQVLANVLPPSIRLVRRFDAGAAWTYGDPGQLEQVVVNLCTNAAHAMEKRGGDLEIQVENVSLTPEFAASNLPLAAGPAVRLAVRDTGSGMTAETLARVFEPFFTTKEPGRGTGLGLSIVHNIVQAHRGRVFIESALGVGTRVEIILPFWEKPAATRPANTTDNEIPRGQGEEILLVDDDASVLSVVDRLLRSLGYLVTAVSSPVAGLERVLREPDRYQLLLTDLSMPEQSGVDFALEVRAVLPALPVIIATGYGPDAKEQLQRAGHQFPILAKPFELLELAKLLQREIRLER